MREAQRRTILKVRVDKGWAMKKERPSKRCDAVDWDQIMDYSLKRRQTTASCEDQGNLRKMSYEFKGFS